MSSLLHSVSISRPFNFLSLLLSFSSASFPFLCSILMFLSFSHFLIYFYFPFSSPDEAQGRSEVYQILEDDQSESYGFFVLLDILPSVNQLSILFTCFSSYWYFFLFVWLSDIFPYTQHSFFTTSTSTFTCVLIPKTSAFSHYKHDNSSIFSSFSHLLFPLTFFTFIHHFLFFSFLPPYFLSHLTSISFRIHHSVGWSP